MIGATISKKICLVGDFAVGKTSLVRRFVESQFSDNYLTTIGVKISRKNIEFRGFKEQENLNLQLLIWDLEGHTKFKAVSPTYLRGASGIVVVADVTRQETISRIPEFIQLFLSINPQGWIVIAMNKSDLVEQEKLTEISNNYQFEQRDRVLSTYFTSAKTGLFVEEMFQNLGCRILGFTRN